MKFILGKKLAMTQVFRDDGNVVPVTAVLVEPNIITQVKTEEKDGYVAVQIGFGKPKNLKKPQIGHLKDIEAVKILREFRLEPKEVGNLKRGDKIDLAVFQAGDAVKVTGTSKGKGFAGVVKRHGFHGSPATHGHKDQLRMPGSIGAGGVQRVFKGVRMAGHMGDEKVTISGLEVVAIDEAKNILYIKGAVPGARNGLLLIYGPGELKTQKQENIETQKQEEVAEPEIKMKEPKIEEVKEEVAQPETAPEIAETKEETIK